MYIRMPGPINRQSMQAKANNNLKKKNIKIYISK